ncbi:MAG: C40 family peptidase [Acidobacteriota bacterium]
MQKLAVCLVAAALGASACASSGAVPRPFPTPGGPPAGSAPVTPPPTTPGGPTRRPGGSADVYAIVGTALSLRGAPYHNGGTDPVKGFDCSGFVQYVFGQHGVQVPREVRDQFRAGERISTGELSPGDLVFFTTVAPGASHVGIAVGGDQFVHAPSSRGVVRVERLSSSYWSSRFVGARRLR